MRGIICYYSGSGNTKLACNYIKSKIKNCQFDLFDIVNDNNLDLSNYEIVGFATFTDAWGVSKRYLDFIDGLGSSGKYAFIFNTFGCISGKTLHILNRLLIQKGFKVIAGHSLHCPENYPPMVAANNGFEDSPNPQEFNKFIQFIDSLDMSILSILENNQLSAFKIPKKIDFIFPRAIAKAYGAISGKEFFVSRDLCVDCGLCEKVCPYNAIALKPEIIFDKTKCNACWACYNHCPRKAIFTKRYKGDGQYSKPNENLTNKLKV